jgi:hypothetical protein
VRFRIDCARVIFVDVEGPDPSILLLLRSDGREVLGTSLLSMGTAVREDLDPSRSILETDTDDFDFVRLCSATVEGSVFGMTGRSSILTDRFNESVGSWS